ncbi:hypothetical protein [Amycolatopsis sp. NBC_01286]|uniref:hypothetical protein n=1 Tax=Amycolatopsis sp. NBC_01286 TaxID=2903560 RepID=UPI002E0F200B|nr:hypothetical protein OG570_31485 [Amycolatopsis sp. NBC_01286]
MPRARAPLRVGVRTSAFRVTGRFRADADPPDIHLLISSLRVFRPANRPEFQASFGRDMPAPATSRPKRIS